MSGASERYAAMLDELRAAGRLRTLKPNEGVDFASNDFLGLANSPELRAAAENALERGVPLGAGASRLLRGNDPEHEALEEEAARFFGAEKTLYFGGGFIANFALFSTLPQRGDLVLHDALIHASAHDGMRAGRSERTSVAHNDAQAFEDAIQSWRAGGGKGRPWIAVESLYSMDGDRAPLADLMRIADRHDGYLIIDEAHATGVWGPDGRGFGAEFEGRENVISLHTCGKSMGAHGALLSLPKTLADFMINRGRPFIFATAPAPLMAAICRASLEIMRTQPARRLRLQSMVETANAAARERGFAEATDSQILPVILGGEERTMAVAAALQAQGFDIRGVRPPTVPAGASRLRLALTLNASEEDLAALLDALEAAIAAHPPEAPRN